MALIRVVSLGAGVQSTTMVLKAARGEITPMPDCAIFADTQSEPTAVYEHLTWLMSGNVLPFPVHVVTAGNLGNAILDATRGQSKRGSYARPPFYVRTLGPNGKVTKGMIRRQCTGDYKIDVIERKLRGLIGLKYRSPWPKELRVEQWIGISTDEASRMKPSQRPAIRMRWPLIELGMSRQDCLLWLERNGYPRPPKSACTFCPYRSDLQWRELRDTDPTGWAQALQIDEAIRPGLTSESLSGELYVHASLKPLAEVDLSTAEERGQLNLFENECEGMCGV